MTKYFQTGSYRTGRPHGHEPYPGKPVQDPPRPIDPDKPREDPQPFDPDKPVDPRPYDPIQRREIQSSILRTSLYSRQDEQYSGRCLAALSEQYRRRSVFSLARLRATMQAPQANPDVISV